MLYVMSFYPFKIEKHPNAYVQPYKSDPNLFQIETVFFLDHKNAKSNPDTICQIPQKAARIAIPPIPLKNEKIKSKPNPEFCIPVSIAIVFWFFKDNLKPLATKNPNNSATRLCVTPMANT